MKKALAGAIILGLSGLSIMTMAGTVRHVEWCGALTDTGFSGMALAGTPETDFAPATGPNKKYVAMGGIETFSKMAIPSCGLKALPALLDTSKSAPLGDRIALSDCPTSKINITVPDGMAIRGIQVCSSTSSENKGIEGLRVWPAVINPDGSVFAIPGPIEKTNTSYCEWRGKKMCPSGQVAVAAVARIYRPSTYTGIHLKCARVRKP